MADPSLVSAGDDEEDDDDEEDKMTLASRIPVLRACGLTPASVALEPVPEAVVPAEVVLLDSSSEEGEVEMIAPRGSRCHTLSLIR